MPAGSTTLRWVRSAVLGAVVLVVAVVAHTSADGRLPSAPVLLLLAALLVLGAHPLLARRASVPRMATLTVGGQALAHGALSLTAGHHGDPVRAAPPVHVVPYTPLAVDEDGRRVGSLLDYARTTPGVGEHEVHVPNPLSHLLGDVSAAGAPMLLTHLVAAAVVGVWLGFGEQALWTVLLTTWDVVLLVSRCRPLTPLLPARVVGVTPPAATWLDRVVAGCVVRRGPPGLLAA